MAVNLGIVMDPIRSITVYKDSSFAMLLEAQARSWSIHYMEQRDLYLKDNRSYGRMRMLKVTDDTKRWFSFNGETTQPLDALDVILMRKDPPFDMEYIYTTYLLELAQQRGALIVNQPDALRDANEKLFTAWFPQCCPPSLVTRQGQAIRKFLEEHGEIVVKPLGGMGGRAIFRLARDNPNINVVIEMLTADGARFAMAQRYIPEISAGDKRILLIDGKPAPYALARIPAHDDGRGNLAAGARGEGAPLSERDRWICEQVAPELVARGLVFVGLDVIGDYLTEINVTSPTCIRELDKIYGLNISALLFEAIEARLA